MSVAAKFKQITPEIATFSRPFERFRCIRIGGRATAIKLRSGELVLFSPIEFEQGIKDKLDSLGKLKYIIAPDIQHHLYIKQYSQRYPDAVLIGVSGIEKIESSLKFAHLYGKDSDKKVGYEDDVCGFTNKDIVLFHKSSKTLIQADLLFNLPAVEQYGSRDVASSGIAWFIHLHLNPFSRLHKWLVSSGVKDKTAMTRDVRTIASLEFDRIIPCHGDVIESGGKQAWVKAYEFLLSERSTHLKTS